MSLGFCWAHLCRGAVRKRGISTVEESNASKHYIYDKDEDCCLLSQKNTFREMACFAFSQCFNLSLVMRQSLEEPRMHANGDIIAFLITILQACQLRVRNEHATFYLFYERKNYIYIYIYIYILNSMFFCFILFQAEIGCQD